MPKYCDSELLELNWFNWLLSSKTPILEPFRCHKLLYTKVIGVVNDNNGIPILYHKNTIPDPMWPKRLHCLALDNPVYFETNDGIPNIDLSQYNSDLRCDLNTVLNLESNSYRLDVETEISWHAILNDIHKMCDGITIKFNLHSEEESHDLSSEAFLQVMRKLSSYKLVYVPGKAPVFNLLTTTIYRVMYSIMNRRKNQREGLNNVLAAAEAGTLPKTNRSLRTSTTIKRIHK